ncbi:MAG: RnfABCDGE type electron transport complex subunit D [Oscillospiraceae bacterium]|nr:RnfABCDGE type electron transport complex subunit D [Oscillospiraceae bacterium]
MKLFVSSAPHITGKDSSRSIMLDVIIAMVPAIIASGVIFGLRAVALTAVTAAACVIFEWLWNKAMKKEQTIGDLSAVVTGILLAFNMPSTMPFWMAVVGAAFAILLVKQLFGGIGYNFANPAITARIILATSFAGAMTNFVYPATTCDAIASATPLAANAAGAFAEGGAPYLTLFLGTHGGVLGETSALALLIGFAYLLIKKVISPAIPVTYVATVAVLAVVFGQDPLFHVLGGGLLLGAIFMATDYVTSPYTLKGKIVFGIGLGLITMMIRVFGTMAEGVSYAILLMNLFVPYINQLTRQKPLGAPKKVKEAK